MSQEREFKHSLDLNGLFDYAAENPAQQNRVITDLNADGGFLVSRHTERFVVIETSMPENPVPNSYVLVKEPEQAWRLIYTDTNVDFQENSELSELPEDIQGILANKDRKDLSEAEEGEIKKIIEAIHYARCKKNLEADSVRYWSINEKNRVPTEQECPGIADYIPYHNQSLASNFKIAFTDSLEKFSVMEDGEKDTPLVMVCEQYTANIQIVGQNKSRVITDNSVFGIGILGEFLTLIPGQIEMVFASSTNNEIQKTGQRFESFKATNSVLLDLYISKFKPTVYSSRKEMKEALQALREKAMKEEKQKPQMLYQWYQKMSKAFISGSLSNDFIASGQSFIQAFSQFLEEFDTFLGECNLKGYFEEDKDNEFSEEFKAAMAQKKGGLKQIYELIIDCLLEATSTIKNTVEEYISYFDSPHQKLEALEKLFKRQIQKENGEKAQQERLEVIRHLKSAYMEIVQQNLEDPKVKEEIIKRDGLIDFRLEQSDSSKSEEREKIEKLQEQKFKYTAKDDENEIVLEEVSIEDNFAQDITRALKINGHRKTSVNDVRQYAKEKGYSESALDNYMKHYMQCHKDEVSNKISANIGEKTGYLGNLDADNSEACLEISQKEVCFVVETDCIMKTGEKGYFSIPGYSRTVLWLENNNGNVILKKKVQFSNTVLRDLYEGNIVLDENDIEANRKIIDKLVERAKKEESPETLYLWYKKQANLFLNKVEDVTFKNYAEIRDINYTKLLENLFSEIQLFLFQNPSYQQKFKNDREFSENFKKIEEQIDLTIKNQLIAIAFVRAVAGDGREGNAAALKRDPDTFSDFALKNLLDLKASYVEKLQNLEDVFQLIIKNENNLYSHEKGFLGGLTATQKKHIALLKKHYLDIVKRYPFELAIRQAALKEKGLIDCNVDVISYGETAERQAVTRLFKEIDELHKDVIPLNVEQAIACRKALDDILTYIERNQFDEENVSEYEQKFKDFFNILAQLTESQLPPFSQERYEATFKYYLSEFKVSGKISLFHIKEVKAFLGCMHDSPDKEKISYFLNALNYVHPTPSYILEKLLGSTKENENIADPFETDNARDAYAKIKFITIEQIVGYVLENPKTAGIFFKKRPNGHALLKGGRNFREEVGKRPDLMKKLFDAHQEIGSEIIENLLASRFVNCERLADDVFKEMLSGIDKISEPAEKLEKLEEIHGIISDDKQGIGKLLKDNPLKEAYVKQLQEKYMEVVQLHPLNKEVLNTIFGVEFATDNDSDNFKKISEKVEKIRKVIDRKFVDSEAVSNVRIGSNKKPSKETSFRDTRLSILSGLYPGVSNSEIIPLSPAQVTDYQNALQEILKHLQGCGEDKASIEALIDKFDAASEKLGNIVTSADRLSHNATFQYYFSLLSIKPEDTAKLDNLIRIGKRIATPNSTLANNIKTILEPPLSLFEKKADSPAKILETVLKSSPDPFDFDQNPEKTVRENYRKIKHINIDQIVDYAIKTPRAMAVFFRKNAEGYAQAVGRDFKDFREKLVKRPDLLETLWETKNISKIILSDLAVSYESVRKQFAQIELDRILQEVDKAKSPEDKIKELETGIKAIKENQNGIYVQTGWLGKDLSSYQVKDMYILYKKMINICAGANFEEKAEKIKKCRDFLLEHEDKLRNEVGFSQYLQQCIDMAADNTVVEDSTAVNRVRILLKTSLEEARSRDFTIEKVSGVLKRNLKSIETKLTLLDEFYEEILTNESRYSAESVDPEKGLPPTQAEHLKVVKEVYKAVSTPVLGSESRSENLIVEPPKAEEVEDEKTVGTVKEAIISLAGDGRKGDRGAAKKEEDNFTKEIIEGKLKGLSALDKLTLLVEIFDQIKKNEGKGENKLYTTTGVGIDLTTTQKTHIKVVQTLFDEIVQKTLKDRNANAEDKEGVQKMVDDMLKTKDQENIVKFNPDRQIASKTVNFIGRKYVPAVVKQWMTTQTQQDLEKEISDYQGKIKKNQETQKEAKKMCLDLIKGINNSALREALQKRLEEIISSNPPGKLPSYTQMKCFVDKINEKLKAPGLNKNGYISLCSNFLLEEDVPHSFASMANSNSIFPENKIYRVDPPQEANPSRRQSNASTTNAPRPRAFSPN